MKRLIKKSFALFLSIFIPLSGILCSCNNSKVSSNAINDVSGSEAKVENNPNNLIWACPHLSGQPMKTNGDTEIATKDILEKLNSLLKEKGYDFSVEFKEFDEKTYKETLLIQKSSGEQIDLISTGYGSTGDDFPYSSFSRSGLFLDITKYLNSEKGEKIKSCVTSKTLDNMKIDSKTYGIAAQVTMQEYYGNAVDIEIQKKYNISDDELRKPISELGPILEKVYQGEKNDETFQTCGSYSKSTSVNFDCLTRCVGVDMTKKDYKAENIYKNPVYKDEYLGYEAFINKGYKIKHDKKCNRCFIRGMSGQKYRDNKEDSYYDDNGNERKTKILIFGDKAYSVSGNLEFRVSGISSWSKNSDKAFDLLYLFNTDKDIVNLLTYGIEGTNYKIVDNEVVKIFDGNEENRLDLWGPLIMLNSFITTNSKNKICDYQLDKKENDEALSSPIFGFFFDESKVKKEITETNSIVDNWTDNISQSDYKNSEQKLAELNSELEKAGIQKVIDEVNKQLDIYKKNKN